MASESRRALLYCLAAIMICAAAGYWGLRPLLAERRRLAAEIEAGSKRLQELATLAADYRRLLAEGQARSRRQQQRSPGFTLFAFLEGLARKDGLKEHIDFMRPSVRQRSGEQSQEVVEMRLSGVTMAQLVPYLYHVETAPEQVRIQRLTIRRQKRQGAGLDVDLVVVTWKTGGMKPGTAETNSRRT